jgi:hypothetical protein
MRGRMARQRQRCFHQEARQHALAFIRSSPHATPGIWSEACQLGPPSLSRPSRAACPQPASLEYILKVSKCMPTTLVQVPTQEDADPPLAFSSAPTQHPPRGYRCLFFFPAHSPCRPSSYTVPIGKVRLPDPRHRSVNLHCKPIDERAMTGTR